MYSQQLITVASLFFSEEISLEGQYLERYNYDFLGVESFKRTLVCFGLRVHDAFI